MATIKQVALAAGVSYTTVSHVLNDTRPVSASARERVLAAAAALHYVPSALARSLRSQSTGTIGLIIPNNTNPYFSEVARGIEDSCHAAGYSVILCNSDDDPVKQRDYLNVLLTKRCDGLIMAALGDTDTGTDTALLRQRRVPTVFLDRAPDGLEHDVIGIDNLAGGALAGHHLLDLGRRRIACISGPRALEVSEQRIAGLRQALAGAGCALDPALCEAGDFGSASGHAAALRLLGRPASERPDALFCCNDMMAIGALRAAAELGIKVPAQLAVVGFDDIDLAQFVHPPLSSVSQGTRALGNITAACLLARIAAPERPLQHHRLVPVLKVRGSSLAAAASPTATSTGIAS